MMATTQPEDITADHSLPMPALQLPRRQVRRHRDQLTQIAHLEGILADPQALALLAEAG